MNAGLRPNRVSRIPLLALTASLGIAVLALLIVTTDGKPKPDETVFGADLYEQSLMNPLLKIEYADHPEYFMKGESTPGRVVAAGTGGGSSSDDESISWQISSFTFADLLRAFGAWLAYR